VLCVTFIQRIGKAIAKEPAQFRDFHLLLKRSDGLLHSLAAKAPLASRRPHHRERRGRSQRRQTQQRTSGQQARGPHESSAFHRKNKGKITAKMRLKLPR
jgi:hypothetical protein